MWLDGYIVHLMLMLWRSHFEQIFWNNSRGKKKQKVKSKESGGGDKSWTEVYGKYEPECGKNEDEEQENKYYASYYFCVLW